MASVISLDFVRIHTRERVAANEPTKITVSIAALREILYTGPTTKLFNNLVQGLKMTANTQADQDGLDTIDDLLKTIASTKATDDDGLALFIPTLKSLKGILTLFSLIIDYPCFIAKTPTRKLN